MRRPAAATSAGGVTPRGTDVSKLGWLVAALVAIALATAAFRLQANPVLAAMAGGLVVVAWQRYLLAWPTLLGYVIVVILFIPIRRYTISAGLPLSLEPYRLLIAGVLLAWLFALLADPETRWRRMGIEAPVIGFTVTLIISIALNVGTITSTGITNEIVKQVSFFASFLLVMYFVSSVITRRWELDGLLVLLVAGGTVVALFSIVEWRLGYNAFNTLERFVPILNLDQSLVGTPERGFRTRAYGSAQHPIALGALLVLLLPLSVYLYRRYDRLAWMACGAVLTLGALATGSRTAATMLLAELVVFLWIKRKETIRLLPMLLPLIIVCQVVMPGTLGTFKAILFPEQGLIAEQQGGEGGTGSGRIADLGPALAEFERAPLFGQGFGTRLTSETDTVVNAQILDNEWLGTLLEVGAIGTLCLLWLYVRSIRTLARAGRADESTRSWLPTALAAALTAFAVGMLTFDAFSFIQVSFVSFILIGVAAVALRMQPERDPAPPWRAS